MKITTRLNIAAFIPALTLLVIVAALAFSYQEMGKIQETGSTVRQIRSSITELNHIVFSYTLYHEERPKQQFTAEYQKLIPMIAGSRVQTAEQQRLLETVRQNVIAMDDLFLQLVETYDSNITAEPGATGAADDRLVGLLLIKSHEANASSALLRGLVDEGLRLTQVRTASLIFVVIVIAAIALTVFQIRTRKSITSNLTNLTSGAAVIGSGNLDFRIEQIEDDEFGELSRAFNQMTANLKDVTASKADLDEEIRKRAEVEEELRVSNEHLQDQTQKLEEEVKERKQAEVSLKESQQRWATTLSSIGDAVIATDMAGRITFMNPVAESLTGWTLGEGSGRAAEEIFNIINEKTREVVESPVARVIRTGLVAGLGNHTVLVRKDGTEVPIDDSGAPIISEEGSIAGVVLVFRDITKRRIAEESIQRLADEWQRTFDSITDPISIQDKDFKLVRVNKAYSDTVGMKQTELAGRKCYEVIHGLTCHIAGCPHEQTVESGKSSTAEFFEPRLGIYLEASTSPILDKNGEVIGTVHIAKNITTRKKSEEALQLERAKLASLLHSMEDGVAIISAGLDVEYINPAMEAVYGPSDGRKCFDYFNGRQDTCPWCRNDEIFAGKTSRRDVQSRKTGKIYEVTYAPLKNEDGTISKLTVWHDITERKRIEEMKDDFIGMVSHELRTPLTIITGAVHTAMLEGLPQEEQAMLLKDAAAGAESLGNILGNLLELTRFQTARLVLSNEPIDIRTAIQEVVAKLKGSSSVHHLKNLSPEGISIVADKVRVERILHNLIENGIKYSPQGGDVRVTARQEDGSLVVGVSDQGIGISAVDQAKLFQPFERLDRLNAGIKGLGLGLVVCRRLVEAHNGRMWVDSEEGKGSTFYFSLPLKS